MLKCWFDSDRRLQVPEHIGDLNCTILSVSTEWKKGVPNYRTNGRDLQLTAMEPASGKVLKRRPLQREMRVRIPPHLQYPAMLSCIVCPQTL